MKRPMIPVDESPVREIGWILPDGEVLKGAPGAQHEPLAATRFPGLEGLDAFFAALDAGWVSYSTGPRHLAIHVGHDRAARDTAARLILELDKSEIAVCVYPAGDAAVKKRERKEMYFGVDERAAARWTRTVTW